MQAGLLLEGDVTLHSLRRQRASETGLDWQATAILLLERSREPAFVVAGDGHVALANNKLLELLSRPRANVVDCHIDEVIPASKDQGAWPLEFAFRGLVREFACSATTGCDRQLKLAVELSVVGSAADACLLAVVTRHQIESGGSGERRYEISLRDRPGALRRVWAHDGTVVDRSGDALCYRELYGRDEPCAGCTLLTQPGSVGRSAVVADTEAGGLRLITSRSVDGDVAEVTGFEIDNELVGQLVQAKVDALAREAGLTEREHDVLRYILLARSADEIGTIIGISARTVKFHQANLLAKIGADSRLDLLRLIL